MEPTSFAQVMTALGAFAAFGFAAIGSAIGCGLAAASAIGSWKRCYAQGKPAPFQLTIFTGAPMSQTFYGMVLMSQLNAANPTYWPAILLIGILGGLGICFSAAYQGRAAAGGCDALSETGKGFANYLIALAIVETIAIFVLVFAMNFAKQFAAAA